MKITFVLPYAGLSGGTRVVSIYAERLRERGHTVRVVSVPHPRVRLRSRVRQWLRGVPARSSSATFFDALPGVLHVIDEFRPVEDRDVPDADVVVATWWETAEWVWRLGPEKGAKAYFIQGHEVFPYLPRDRVEATLRLPMHKIAVAGWLRTTMAELYGDRGVSVVENGVDATQFHAPPRGKQPRPTIGMLYSRAVVKGFADGCRVVEALRPAVPGLRVIVFGSEAPRADLPLPAGAEFHRSPAQDQLRGVYGSLDAWLCSSTSEGFGLTILEAMACRTPVVSTRVGIAPEAIEPGVNGFLSDTGDIPGLVRGLRAVLDAPEDQWRRMSEGAWRRARDYTWESATTRMEGALRLAIERAAHGEVAGGAGAGTR